MLLKLHLVLALASSVVVLTLGLTGAVMAFEPEIQHWQHRTLLDVTPGGTPHALIDVSETLMRAFPAERVKSYWVPESPTRSVGAVMDRGTVYVNPYTLQILGTIPPGQDWLARVHQLHLRFVSPIGQVLVRITGVVMIALTVSGLYLWMPSRRTRITSGARGFRLWFDWHAVIGVYSAAFLLVLSLTGTFITFDGVTVPLAYRLTGSTPAPAWSPRQPALAGAHQLLPDRALEIAREAVPGASAFHITMPTPTEAFIVRLRFPEDRTPGGRSRVMLNSYTGQVMQIENSRTAPGGRRIENLNRAIHTGDIFGLVSKTAMALGSLMAPLQLLTGVMMWRRRKRA